jgi:hypothetical protein
MGQALDGQALDTLFREARSFTKMQPRPVTDSWRPALAGLREVRLKADTVLHVRKA